jgi:predicted RND superfamily exporter protein
LESKEVLTSIVVSIVKACTRFASLTVLIAFALAVAAGYYTANNFSINTDINTLISPTLDWRKRDNQFDQAFDRDRTILAVVDAPTPELTTAATAALAKKLSSIRFRRSVPENFLKKKDCCFCPRPRSAASPASSPPPPP